MKQVSKTCYISDDNHIACALTDDHRYAIVENDVKGIVLIKIFETLSEAKEYVLDYEMAIKEFEKVFK
jgi:hypothetical protein